MQNWKIKRMSYRRINQWLSAIGKLLRCYEGKIKLKICPLCQVAHTKGCEGICPWYVIEGKSCDDFAMELYSEDAVAENCRNGLIRYRGWKVARLRQLRNWKQIFQAELDRRTEGGTP